MDPGSLSEFLAVWGYPALLVLLLLTGVGSPVPEDLLLLVAGYLIFTGALWWPLALPVCVIGVLGSDLILYAAGRRLGWRGSGPIDALVSPTRLRRATRWFDRIGPPVVLAARLIPGTRAIVFVTAGLRGIAAARFVLYDTVGALVWVPALLFAGHAAGEQIGSLEQAALRIQNGAIWVLAVAAVLVAAWLVLGREESKL